MSNTPTLQETSKNQIVSYEHIETYWIFDWNMVQIEIPFDFLAVSVPLLGSCHHEAIASASLPGRRRLVYVYILVSDGAKVSQTS